MWDVFLRWIYTTVYDAISEFFTSIGEMGVEIFELAWIEAALKLFMLVGWALFVAGLTVAVFDLAIEYQGQGRINIRTAALNLIKGFFAVSLFSTLPVELYKFCVTLQNTFAGRFDTGICRKAECGTGPGKHVGAAGQLCRG